MEGSRSISAVVCDVQGLMLTVKKNIAEMEHLVEQAEADLGCVSTLKKVFNSVTLPSFFTPVTLAIFLVVVRFCEHA